MRRVGRAALAAALAAGAVVLGAVTPAAAAPTPIAHTPAGAGAALAALGGTFEENLGQAGDEVRFLSRFGQLTVGIADDASVLQALDDGRVVITTLDGGADAPVLAGEQRLRGTVNYTGDVDVVGAPTFRQVRADEVYPGVDQVFRPAGDGAVAYDFVVGPGADPSPIVQRFDGIEGLRVAEDGSLRLDVGEDELVHSAPVAYQETGGGRRVVESSFVLVDRNAARFEIGAYDPSLPLVIDPTLLASSYVTTSTASLFGGASVVGPDGAVYVSFRDVSSPTGTFRPPAPPFLGGTASTVTFLARFTPDLSDVDWVTYLPNTSAGTNTFARSVVKDLDVGPDGSITAVGFGDQNFAATPGTVQPTYRGARDEFDIQTFDAPVALQFAPTGALRWATFLGAPDPQRRPRLITVDVADNGDVAVVGTTTDRDFPVTAGADQRFFGLATVEAAFLAVLAPDARSLRYATFLGGATTVGIGVGFDASGGVTVGVNTDQNAFPTTREAFARRATDFAPAVVRFRPGTGPFGRGPYVVDWSTRIGNSGTGYELEVDDAGHSYLVGGTDATWPTTPGVFGPSTAAPNGDPGFVTKLAPTGDRLVWSTFIGEGQGAGRQGAGLVRAVEISPDGSPWISGYAANWPQTAGAVPTDGSASLYAFVTKFDPTASRLVYSTLFGSDTDPVFVSGTLTEARGLAADPDGGAYLFGVTSGRLLDTTPGAFLEDNPAVHSSESAVPVAAFVAHFG